MVTIRNTNDAYGDPVEITGETLESAVAEFQSGLRSCGPEFYEVVIGPDDYDIVLPDEAIRELGVITTRDESGRHFTEWSRWLETLELLDLVTVYRPRHEATGIPYGQEAWTLEVTDDGQDVVNDHVHLFE